MHKAGFLEYSKDLKRNGKHLSRLGERRGVEEAIPSTRRYDRVGIKASSERAEEREAGEWALGVDRRCWALLAGPESTDS